MLSIEIIINKIIALSNTDTSLDLSQTDFYAVAHADLLATLITISETITDLDLSWNFPGDKSLAELKELFRSLPKGLKRIDLSGQSLHLRPYSDLIQLIECISPEIEIRVEYKPLQLFIRFLRNDSNLGNAEKARAFLSALGIKDNDEVWVFFSKHIDGLTQASPVAQPSSPPEHQTSQQWDQMLEELNIPTAKVYVPKKIQSETPVKLRQLLEQYKAQPNMSQIIDLMTSICDEIDYLSQDLVFYPSIDSIYIINPQEIGSNNPLQFRFCPSARKLTTELASGIERHVVHRRMLAQLFLLVGAQTTQLNDPKLAAKIKHGWSHSPAFMTLFSELWKAGTHNGTKKIIELSPSLQALAQIRSQEKNNYKIEQVPGLISGLTCHGSSTMHKNAVDGLWRFFLSATKKEKVQTIYLLSHCIELLVPQVSGPTSIPDPASATRSAFWIQRMLLIAAVLQGIEQSGDYELLQQVQQRLIEADIGKQLDGRVASNNSKFNLKVLLAMTLVTVRMALQNNTMRSRFIFDYSVRKMSSFLLQAIPKSYIQENDAYRYILIMLVMSDFSSWLNIKDPIDNKLQAIWSKASEELFLQDVLPACPTSLSPGTAKAIVSKLEAIVVRMIQQKEYGTEQGLNKLQYCLDHLSTFAWNGQEQAARLSYKSLYQSHFTSLIFRNPRHTLFYDGSQQQFPVSPSLNFLCEWMDSAAFQPNVLQAPVVRRQFKSSLRTHDFVGIVESHKLSIMSMPAPFKAGAPLNKDAVFLALPANSGVAYYAPAGVPNLNLVQSLGEEELRARGIQFRPLNLTTTQRICSVVDPKEHIGTQGLFEVRVFDAGEHRKLLIGLTWDKGLDGDPCLPGSTATSLALDCATGHIKYLDDAGKQLELPYTKPIHSGDKVWIGICNNQVYFAVNETFYPPIPNLELPLGADVHPLMRFADLGIKISTEVMTSPWDLRVDANKVSIHATTNPLAYAFYSAGIKVKFCPHYHAKQNPRQQEPSQLTKLLQSPQQLADLPDEALRVILMIVLAHKECIRNSCPATETLRVTKANIIAAAQPNKNSSARDFRQTLVTLAQKLDLPELATLLQAEPSTSSSFLPNFSMFNVKQADTHPKAAPSNAHARGQSLS
ncbi:hypothetical protein BN59_02699 [Legionella massiliensis]|uniref:Uncharacterized protein n=1 Tax=Legionella massiliensis TaxID=1034943 RepID=A0A078L2P4_9GAMM|nr:hypothetical protein [Legionella massiliensis]CDZ78389.1 hypothetical protein BN59_02699 [Legionella massiliensis]CEE14127.1 hypothetical protein BN1094_02699 [Legionella massiliensis]